MTTDKEALARLNFELREAILDNQGVECQKTPEIFYPEDFGLHNKDMIRIAEVTAREICLRCPVMAKCLKVGLFEDYGIWGGATPAQRKLLRREHTE